MGLKIWIHQQHKKVWYRYWKPTWLNSITYKKGDKKIYRWLFWGFTTPFNLKLKTQIRQTNIQNLNELTEEQKFEFQKVFEKELKSKN